MSKTYQIWTREGPRELTRKEWWDFEESLLHRVDGPAWIDPNGTEWWCQNGQRHRTNGPAMIFTNGTECWYQNGQRHRTNGPAVIHPDGTEWWFLNDNQLPKDDVELWIKTNDINLNRLEDQIMFLTEWRPE